MSQQPVGVRELPDLRVPINGQVPATESQARENSGDDLAGGTFYSILFNAAATGVTRETTDPPSFFADLNLDQIVDVITAGKQEYDLKPFFFAPLRDTDTILYRQEIARDLENETVMGAIRAFAHEMSIMRRYLGLTSKLRYQYHKAGWFLEAADVYCQAVTGLAENLQTAVIASLGLAQFRRF